MRRLAIFTGTIVATLLVLYVMWAFSSALVLFATSLAISAMLRPLVAELEKRNIRRGWAILICYIGMLALVGAIGYFLAGQLSKEVTYASETLPQAYVQTREQLLASDQGIIRNAGSSLPTEGSAFLESLGYNAAYINDLVLSIISNLVSNLIFIIAVLSLAFYWLSEISRFERLWLALLPVTTRIRARDIWRNSEAAVGTYIRAIVIAIIVGTMLLYVLFWATDLPMPMTLALLGGFSHLFPRIGPAIGVIPAILLALITKSVLVMVIVAIVAAVIQVVVHHIGDRIMRHGSIAVNPLLQVLVILVLVEALGLWSVIFAPPLAALVQVLHANIMATSTVGDMRKSAMERLTERMDNIQQHIDEDSLELRSAYQRSNDLLTQARDMLGTES